MAVILQGNITRRGSSIINYWYLCRQIQRSKSTCVGEISGKGYCKWTLKWPPKVSFAVLMASPLFTGAVKVFLLPTDSVQHKAGRTTKCLYFRHFRLCNNQSASLRPFRAPLCCICEGAKFCLPAQLLTETNSMTSRIRVYVNLCSHMFTKSSAFFFSHYWWGMLNGLDIDRAFCLLY